MVTVIGPRFMALPFCMVLIGMMMIMMLCNFQSVWAQSECKGTRPPDLLAKCTKFVEPSGPKIKPSPECCSAIRGADIPCLCKYVSKEIERTVSMEKVVYVCRTCGRDLPAGMQCGSYKVPPPQG